jgi:Protein of unknown function (DUF3159)
VPTEPGAPAVPTVEALIRQRLSAALGGWRGSLETAVPTLVFVVAWVWREQLVPAVVASAVVALLLGVVRVVQRQSLQFVLSAVFPTAIAAFFALRSGRAEDAFLPGILWNTALLVLGLVSVATRWPLVGFMVGVADPRASEDPFAWRRDRGLVRVAQRLTLVMLVAFAIRVAVMLPLYLAGNVAALGVAKVVLGWPLWLGAVAVMGAMLVRGSTPQQDLTAEAGPDGASDAEHGHSAPRGIL